MKINRRQILLGSTAFIAGAKLKAAERPASVEGTLPALVEGRVEFQQGWHTLPVGAGGLITGFDIAPDGTMVCRADVYGAYRWSGTTDSVENPNDRWVQLYNASLGVGEGCYEIVIAYSQTSRLAMIARNNSGSGNTYALYITDDGGATWRNTGLNFNNADGNGTSLQKNASGKIVFDPNNANVCYVGMPAKNNQTAGLFRSTNGGRTFAPVRGIAAPTLDPGVAGMRFDVRSGVTTKFEQTVTKRLLVPVAGVGLYESLDGGVTFNEVGNAALGTVSVFMSQIDYDGVYYINNNAGTDKGYLWRYSGPGGTWVQLDAQRGWSVGAGWLGNTGLLVCDPRPGHQGYLTVAGPNGHGAGFTSFNANAANPATITWGGGTGGEVPTTVAPSYDVQWLNHGVQGYNVFIGATYGQIDQHGVEWWSGNQGFWFFSKIRNYQISMNTTSNSVSRGFEETVTTGICKPPGSALPILTMQDVGMMRAPVDAFPPTYYVPGWRMDAYNCNYAVTDPNFLVVKAETEANSPRWSGYSTAGGADGSWTPYATMPDTLWDKLPGGFSSVGGQIIAFNHDRHLCCGQGYATKLQPVFTTNATSPSCNWSFCLGLPTWNWFPGSFYGGPPNHPFAADYVDIGTAYCVAQDGTAQPLTPSKIFRSTDFGATWSQVSSVQLGAGGNFSNVFLYATPGHAGDLWLFVRGTGGGGTGPQGALGLFRSRDHGVTWTWQNPPSPYLIPHGLSFGAVVNGYPSLWMAWYNGYGSGLIWAYSTDQGGRWTTLTGALDPNTNAPLSCKFAGINHFTADPDVFGRLYFGTYSAGFFYYSP